MGPSGGEQRNAAFDGLTEACDAASLDVAFHEYSDDTAAVRLEFVQQGRADISRSNWSLTPGALKVCKDWCKFGISMLGFKVDLT
eukprot:5705493-Lingulodinium_polyedra.AAC.1